MNDGNASSLPAVRRPRPLHRYVATWQTPPGPQFSILFARDLRQARIQAEKLVGQTDPDGINRVWNTATSVSVKLGTGRHNIPLLEAALLDPILMVDDRHESHAAARQYLAGWNQGRLDGLDLHYGRDHLGSAGAVLKKNEAP